MVGFGAAGIDLMMRLAVVLISLVLCGQMFGSQAQAEQTVGAVSGQPVPRFVSLKSSQTNLREGPSRDHRIAWVFKRAGVPVEVIAEFETWRRIRDSEGSEGWVLHSMLSGRRTALIAPWSKEASLPVYDFDSADAAAAARLQPGVLANIERCNGQWCRLNGDGFRGWIQQEKLWGAYPKEDVK